MADHSEKQNEVFAGLTPIGGWAPGNYCGKCRNCGGEFTGDKRALHCQSCGIKTELAFLRQTVSDASEAVSEALSLCQQSAAEWMASSPELRDFKLKIFATLEMRCLNLSHRTRGRAAILASNQMDKSDG
jgi:hypothetical protein